MIKIPHSSSRRYLPAFLLTTIAATVALTCVHAFDGFNGPVDVFSKPDPNASPSPASGGTTLPNATGNTIVDANQRVRTTKRGVCENHMSAEDFKAMSPGVSWYYNWASTSSDIAAPGDHMEYIPMAWGRSGDAGAVAGSLGRRPRFVLALNEPNLKGQAFLPPDKAAEMYKEVKMAADAQKITVVGPNMSLGSATGDSIKAKDPVSGKEVVYTGMDQYLDAFNYYLKKENVTPGPLGIHSYGGIGELKGKIGEEYGRTHKPVFVTEFAFWNAPDAGAELQYLKEAVEFMESSSQVGGYAWFMNRADKNPKISLLDKESGKLTPLGEAYVKLPSHSSTVFYRIPGLLDAGKYVATENMKLDDTGDSTGGDYDMISSGPATVDYNIQVDTAGTYALKLRLSGLPGKIEVMQNGQVLGSVDSTKAGWHTEETSVPLLAGAQTLRIRCNGQTLHSIDFAMLK